MSDAFRAADAGAGAQRAGELLGVMEAVNKRGGGFDPDDRLFAEIFAAIAAAALEALRTVAHLRARSCPRAPALTPTHTEPLLPPAHGTLPLAFLPAVH
jgi:GAF domain-containing protein